jgi:hypothetical protein
MITHRVLTIALATAVVALAPAQAQERRAAPGGAGEAGPRPYEAAQEETVTGTFVRSFDGPFGELTIYETTVQGKTLNLLLGPPAFVKQQKFEVASGATLEVIGVPGYKANGSPALLVRQIKSGKQTLTLRRPNGEPVWKDARGGG